MYKLGDFNIRATYSNGFKAPTLKELHDDYITQIGGGPWKHYYGNKDLKPQKSNYYSASVEYHASNLQITVTGFYNRIKNMIALTEIPTSAEDRLDEIEASMQHKNLSKARSFGGDISLTYQILSSLAIGGGYSYTDAKRNIRMIRPTRIICSTPRSMEPHSIMPIGTSMEPCVEKV